MSNPVSFPLSPIGVTPKSNPYWVTNILICILDSSSESLPCGSAGKESAYNVKDLGLIPGLGRSPGEGKGYPLQYSGLENSLDCIVHGVAKCQTLLSDFHFHFLKNAACNSIFFSTLLSLSITFLPAYISTEYINSLTRKSIFNPDTRCRSLLGTFLISVGDFPDALLTSLGRVVQNLPFLLAIPYAPSVVLCIWSCRPQSCLQNHRYTVQALHRDFSLRYTPRMAAREPTDSSSAI